ncbi:hypothetical protein [Nocardioides pyridinolyticus]
MNVALIGNLLIAVAGTVQAIRWLTVEARLLGTLDQAAATRTDRLAVRRRLGRANIDWTVWTAIALGAWLIFFAEAL